MPQKQKSKYNSNEHKNGSKKKNNDERKEGKQISKSVVSPVSKEKIKEFATLRGMKDILPREGKLFQQIYHAAEDIADAYGFSYIETPIVEQASLFIRSVGKGTDIVNKEMYLFEDNDSSKVCLRPEGTASVARAYTNHGMHTLPQPVKTWYWGPMFRHDRPQAGRYREFHQFSCESIGEHSPVVDAELISVAYNVLRDLGISTMVHVNSIGTPVDRENYLVELSGYLKSKRSYLSEESKKRMLKNPLRVLDSKEEQDASVIAEAPQIIDWLSDESKKFFMTVLEYLDEAKIPYVLTPTLVRGLDYYTDTVFELYEEGIDEQSQNALGGGGRYDGLVEQLGGQPTPGAGFSLGIERVVGVVQRKQEEERKKLRAEGKESEISDPEKTGGIFFAQLGEQARKRSLFLIEDLRRNGITVYHNLAKSSLKTQLELANKKGVSHTLILGQKEMQDGTVLVRNMESGIQEIIDQRKLKHMVEKLRNTP
jgi:histidyl-tRNA synthetase